MFNIRQLQLACLTYFNDKDYAAFRLFLAVLKLFEGVDSNSEIPCIWFSEYAALLWALGLWRNLKIEGEESD